MNYSKVIVFAMIAAGMVAAKATETEPVNKKAASEVCFEFNRTINKPGLEAMDPNNYTIKSILVCENGSTLCGVCFDQDEFPLDPNGFIDFENNPLLEGIVQENKDRTDLHGEAIPVPGSSTQTVTLYFRN